MIKELEKKNKWKYLKNLYKKNNNKKIIANNFLNWIKNQKQILAIIIFLKLNIYVIKKKALQSIYKTIYL